MSAALAVNDLTAGYLPGVDILHGVSLQVRAGEIVALLGPNGCGKSTLLKTVAGFLHPRRGAVVLSGQDVSRMPVHLKVRHAGVGFVPQTDNVFGSLSVWENLALGGRSLAAADAGPRIDALLDAYPALRRKARRPASALSGGERQILSLARALVPRPSMLLLDEPSAGLSPKMLVEVFDAIVAVRNGGGVSILMVEQNATEALRIADRACVLALGRVAIEGPSRELAASTDIRELYLGGRAH